MLSVGFQAIKAISAAHKWACVVARLPSTRRLPVRSPPTRHGLDSVAGGGFDVLVVKHATAQLALVWVDSRTCRLVVDAPPGHVEWPTSLFFFFHPDSLSGPVTGPECESHPAIIGRDRA